MKLCAGCICLFILASWSWAEASSPESDTRGAERIVESNDAAISCTERAEHSRVRVESPPQPTEPVSLRPNHADSDVLYRSSVALLIGQEEYDDAAVWRPLRTIPDELDKVSSLLLPQGFTVIRAHDLNIEELRGCFWSFFDEYGSEKNARLVVFFSGHGETKVIEDANSMGYLIATDTPDKTDGKFFSRALSIEEIMLWTKHTPAKHILLLFDSCFSGHAFDLFSGSALSLPHPAASTRSRDMPLQPVALGRQCQRRARWSRSWKTH